MEPFTVRYLRIGNWYGRYLASSTVPYPTLTESQRDARLRPEPSPSSPPNCSSHPPVSLSFPSPAWICSKQRQGKLPSHLCDQLLCRHWQPFEPGCLSFNSPPLTLFSLARVPPICSRPCSGPSTTPTHPRSLPSIASLGLGPCPLWAHRDRIFIYQRLSFLWYSTSADRQLPFELAIRNPITPSTLLGPVIIGLYTWDNLRTRSSVCPPRRDLCAGYNPGHYFSLRRIDLSYALLHCCGPATFGLPSVT